MDLVATGNGSNLRNEVIFQRIPTVLGMGFHRLTLIEREVRLFREMKLLQSKSLEESASPPSPTIIAVIEDGTVGFILISILKRPDYQLSMSEM